MAFNNFRFNVIVRVIVITLTIMLFANLIASKAFLITVLLVLILVVIQVVSLIRFIEKSNESASNFLNTFNEATPPARKDSTEPDSFDPKSFPQYNKIMDDIKKSTSEKDAKYQYLKTIVQHIGIGIITFNRNGDIQIINTAAKKFFRVSFIRNMHELRSISDQLVDSFMRLKTGGRDLIKITHPDETIRLAVFAIELSLQGEEFKLVSLQNIQSELEENEMEAWQKLVRVLTHEIMNSVTPISSLANTLEEDLKGHMDIQSGRCEMTVEEMKDFHLAIQTIQKRSDGLIRFVTDFRSLTHIPKIKFSEVNMKDLFDHIDMLMRPEIEQKNIKFERAISPDDLKIKIDQELVEQVLINLLKNSIQALEDSETPHIRLSAYNNEKNSVFISVKDNGPGIDEDAQTKIFIPFYTTKKNGSGIGLSLSKQIMRQHLGNISVKSKIDEGTEFILRF
jgi:two-component system, NtrC family, nitrogen regulation sensor histidine kinase NtrY